MKKLRTRKDRPEVNRQKRVCQKSAQADIDQIRHEASTKRRLRSDAWPALRKHAAEILAWASANGGSRAYVTLLIRRRLEIQTSPSQVYRFVKHMNDGEWPRPRQKQAKEPTYG